MPDDSGLIHFTLETVSWLHVLLLITIVQRISELPKSKRNEKVLRKKGAIEAGKDHYGAIVVLHTLWLVSMVLEITLIPRSINPFWPALLLVWIATQALRYWTLSTLGDRWTTRVLVLKGERPITSGPYRYLRHPNYVVVILEIFILPMIFSCYVTAITFSIINAVLLSIRIRAEARAWREIGSEKKGEGRNVQNRHVKGEKNREKRKR